MIRINLLESITDKPTSPAVIVEKRLSSPASRLGLLAGIVAGLLVLGIGFDYMTATSAQAAAEAEMVNQKKIAAEMETVMKEQEELKKRIKDIDDRILAIKDLRSKQAGPSAVLEALRERIGNSPGLYLESVEQKGEQLTIKGNSPDEFVVTNFGRSLEFSSGLFTNLNIETQRKEVSSTQVADSSGAALGSNPDAPKLETVNFTIRCAYTPSKAANPASLPNGQQTASNNAPAPTAAPVSPAAPGAPTQTAKN
ncbi:MAG TPA: PilN domain-containing protein [Pyrinomonadaceae bacterium]|jgi:Tfp pilus assembly protein PilN|nr:PilN domain-containing protein [Pyrinomonadaceae bacterium]